MRERIRPRRFRNGQGQVYGCSPASNLIWLLFSLILTVTLNLLLNLIFYSSY